MIDWSALGIEFVVALLFAGGAVTVFALGLRLLAVGAPTHLRLASTRDDAVEEVPDADPGTFQRPAGASVLAYLCFAVDVAVVLYGLYLIIPQLHP